MCPQISQLRLPTRAANPGVPDLASGLFFNCKYAMRALLIMSASVAPVAIPSAFMVDSVHITLRCPHGPESGMTLRNFVINCCSDGLHRK